MQPVTILVSSTAHSVVILPFDSAHLHYSRKALDKNQRENGLPLKNVGHKFIQRNLKFMCV